MMAQRTVVIVVDDDPSLLKSVARLLAYNGIDNHASQGEALCFESDSMQTATCLLLNCASAGSRRSIAAPP